ncbi:MAG TPA: hypothetical protein VNE59_02105 [Burkholderiales bacterium]|nr:hypothetical protein [Burkholderiales bacterium]
MTAKNISVTDVGALKNELRKYKHGRKLDIPQFNQAARLAWLGRIVLSPLDPEDPECRAWLLHLEPPEGLAGEILQLDQDLMGRIHVLDAEQGERLAEILREGVQARARELAALEQRDFYLVKFFRPKEGA